jgi:hypothetical protein
MGFTRTIPDSPEQLLEYLVKLHENQKHIESARVDRQQARIEIDLDWKANKLGGYPDVYIPVRPGREAEAEQLVGQIMSRSKAGFAPTAADADQLFMLIQR